MQSEAERAKYGLASQVREEALVLPHWNYRSTGQGLQLPQASSTVTSSGFIEQV